MATAKALLAAGADLEIKNQSGRYPITEAVKNGHTEVRGGKPTT